MSPLPLSPIARAWYKWKTLRLPWRKRFLVGYDLQGNTFWEFRLTRGEEGGEKWRRIVHYPRSTYLSEVKVSPLWHQWLRHTRADPPSINEQQSDVVRQARMKHLAAAADARWDAKARVMDAPPEEATQALNAGEAQPESQAKEAEEQPVAQEDPWAKARANAPGETWQPTAWSPKTGKK